MCRAFSNSPLRKKGSKSAMTCFVKNWLLSGWRGESSHRWHNSTRLRRYCCTQDRQKLNTTHTDWRPENIQLQIKSSSILENILLQVKSSSILENILLQIKSSSILENIFSQIKSSSILENILLQLKSSSILENILLKIKDSNKINLRSSLLSFKMTSCTNKAVHFNQHWFLLFLSTLSALDTYHHVQPAQPEGLKLCTADGGALSSNTGNSKTTSFGSINVCKPT